MLRRIILLTTLIPPFFGIMIVSISKRLTYGIEHDEIFKAKELLLSKEVFGNAGQYIGLDTGVILFLYTIKEYSYWIIIISLIWTIVVLYMYFSINKSKGKSVRRELKG